METHYRRAVAFLFIQSVLLTLGLALLAIPTATPAFAASCTGLTNQDYGDAPVSYGDACARVSGNLYIGSTVPVAKSPQHDANAALDAQENFLNPLTPIDIANGVYTWTIPVHNNTGSTATLAGWIDFNHDGAFQANERAAANVTLSTAVTQNITLTWNIPVTATYFYTQSGTTTFARLRISTDANVGPIDSFGTPTTTDIGEVEDYAVSLVESDVCAPGTSFYYIQANTTTSNDFIATVNASTGVTTFVNNPPTPASGFPGINGIAVDHYRDFVYYQDAADVNCVPNCGTSPVPRGIYGYNVLANSNFTVTTDALASLGVPVTNGWQTASGAFANGKYYAGVDGDDTGRIYEITLNSAGTGPVSSRLLISPDVNGSCVPNNPTGGDECRGYGDILIVGNQMYVALWQGATPQTQIFDVYDINSQLRTSRQILVITGFAFQLGRDGNGRLYAVTSDNGRIFPISNGQIQCNATCSNPISTIGAPIRDAAECPVSVMDFGDAPNYYGTDVGPLAARSTITSNIRLGTVSNAAIISDTHGYASSNAQGDDTTGPGDDEDAVASIPNLSSSASSYTLPNITVFNNSGHTAFLYGWVDFDRDGVFEPSERVTATIPTGAASQSITLTWTIPGGTLTAGQSYIRLRISDSTVTTSTLGTGTDGAFLATGFAPNGEVEDYALTIGSTTAVQVSALDAYSLPSPIRGEQAWVGVGIGALVAVMSIAGFAVWRRRKYRRIAPPTQN